MSPTMALNSIFSEMITSRLRQLLESKHLYQSVSLESEIEVNRILITVPDNSRPEIQRNFQQLIAKEWYPFKDATSSNPIFKPQHGMEFVQFRPPDVKLFCSLCDRVEAFNLTASEDFLMRDSKSITKCKEADETVQVFAISYTCQSCKSVPEVFLITRSGIKLTVSGRAPIEHVDVPSVIPKKVRSLFSGAVVAHQSGQTLAGIFLLRTILEQWARSVTQSNEREADRVIDAYMEKLPLDFRQRFDSMKELYGELSADMHGALGSSELFETSIEKLRIHFDALRLFKLTYEFAPRKSDLQQKMLEQIEARSKKSLDK